METNRHRHAVSCILPPYILDRLATHKDPAIRRAAVAAIALSKIARMRRARATAQPVAPPPAKPKRRLVYDARHGEWAALPGKFVRSEGDPEAADPAVNEAYDQAGTTYDFYFEVFKRNSLDNAGLPLISSVHFGKNYDNAFWSGEQMVYGDGDGVVFVSFTRALDVVAHELIHGVVSHECDLVYQDEPGALNEHFADVFGILTKQWKGKIAAEKADWLIGADIMGPQPEATAKNRARGLRTFKDEPAFEDNPYLGTDPQPKRLRDKYTGHDDNGGVHLNSGIPNCAFYRVATALGGAAWNAPGAIWYETLKALNPQSGFAEMVTTTVDSATKLFGAGSNEARAVAAAWKAVGF